MAAASSGDVSLGTWLDLGSGPSAHAENRLHGTYVFNSKSVKSSSAAALDV
jgi:hypothetical protein